MTNILHINSSARHGASNSRKLSAELVKKLEHANYGAKIVSRDVASGVEFVDEAWVGANITPADKRSAEQKARLANSDMLVTELQVATHIVIAAPIYNFGIPAALKAWIDQICRAGATFQYGPTGPVGLLKDKKAYLVITSGGVEIQGPVDYATNYLKFLLGFIGITDVTVIAANQLNMNEAKGLQEAHAGIDLAA